VLARLLTTARIGIGLVLLPPICLLACIGWEESRIWTPLDIPVSFSEGRIRTASFEINVRTAYDIVLLFDRSWLLYPATCEGGICQPMGPLDATWSVSKNGRVALNEKTQVGLDHYDLGRFVAGRGHYAINLEVHGDVAILNSASPRLRVEVAGGEQNHSAAWLNSCVLFCWCLTPIGVFMLIRVVNANREQDETASILKHALRQAGWPIQAGSVATVRRKRCVPHRPLCLKSSTSSLILVTVLAAGGLFIWPLYFLSRPTPRGLPIRLLRSEYQPPSHGIQPVLIRIARNHDITVSGQAVSPEDFGSVLGREIAQRPPAWPLYIEGDPNLEWMDIVRVIDAVQADGRDVVLLKSGER
jgi:biopolymer transport protein ExbD